MRRPKLNLPEVEGLTEQQILFLVEYIKDFNAYRAAEASGYSDPAYGHTLLKKEAMARAVGIQLNRRLEDAGINAAWVLEEMVDNHYLARQAGDIKASNAALQAIGKLATVDAFAADKLVVTDDEKLRERLERGRQRVSELSMAKVRSFI